MILDYIESAMSKAHYEILEDEKSYYGEISGFQGVWAKARNLEVCRNELQTTLEEWLLIRLRRNLKIPRIKGISLLVKEVA